MEKSKDTINNESASTIPIDIVEEYINQMTDHEKKTFKIAQEHLGTSFNIKRSIGFINWKEKQKS